MSFVAARLIRDPLARALGGWPLNQAAALGWGGAASTARKRGTAFRGRSWTNAPASRAFALGLAVTTDAFAHCRSRTVREAACDEVDDSGCRSCGKPLFWRSRCVGFSLQEDASRHVAYDAAERAVARGFARWATAGCPGGAASIDARNLGPVSCGSVGFTLRAPNQNTITFRDGAWKPEDPGVLPGGLRGETIALTTTSFSTRTGEIFGADMEINSAQFTFSADGLPGASSFDLEAVVTHEAGHFLGLAHTAERSAVMYAGGEPGRTLQRELKEDDLRGICEAYPADGTRAVAPEAEPTGVLASTACEPIPPNGLSRACTTNPEVSCALRPATRRSGSASPAALAAGAALALVARLLRRGRNRATLAA